MSAGLLSMILVVSFMLSILFYTSFQNKRNVSLMSGMVVAMGIGMIVGLLSGVIFGIAFKGNLFISTVYSVGIGIIIGGVIGSFYGIIAFLDGILSGLMGGMMGAMLGEMILPLYHELSTRLLFVFFLALSFTLIYLIVKESENNGLITFFRNPLTISVMFVLMLLLSNLFGPVWTIDHDENIHNHHSFSDNESFYGNRTYE
ncbi:hypothetical protein IM538_12665 [Cytobacillus suaedae]|nr:hypothetical protein IM538_12665 [Cytobacillus suaedae]